MFNYSKEGGGGGCLFRAYAVNEVDPERDRATPSWRRNPQIHASKRFSPQSVLLSGGVGEREIEKFIDNQAQRPVGSHRLCALGLQHMTASTIPPLSVWPCGLSATHKRAQTVSGPPQQPIRSLEVSGSQRE